MKIIDGIEVKKALELFRSILSQSWPYVLEFEKHDTFDNFRIDWLQGNWELTVEQSLLYGASCLQIYGEGADCNGASSRVLYPDKIATHEIVCLPRDNRDLHDLIRKKDLDSQVKSLVFEQFVRMTPEGWYEEGPEFDCVLAYQSYGGGEVVLKFDDLVFELREVIEG